MIVLLDQFTRNAFRDTSRAFEGDAKALSFCLDGISKDFPFQLKHPLYQLIFFHPLMHVCFFFFIFFKNCEFNLFDQSENLEMQNKSVEYFSKIVEKTPKDHVCYKFTELTLDFANKHREVILKYGRFPHRNKLLFREDTEEEKKNDVKF